MFCTLKLEVPEQFARMEAVFLEFALYRGPRPDPFWRTPEGRRAPAPEQGFSLLSVVEESWKFPNVAAIRGIGRMQVFAGRSTETVHLAVHMFGEGTHVTRLLGTNQQGSTIELRFAPWDQCNHDVVAPIGAPRTLAGIPQQYLYGPAEYEAELDKKLASMPETPKRRHQLFFADMDRATHPQLMDLPSNPVYLNVTKPLLVIRNCTQICTDYLTRRLIQLRSRDRTPFLPLDSGFLPRIDATLALFETLVGQHYEGDLEAFGEALDLFANGDLRIQLDSGLYTSQPSSGYFFLFAELAFIGLSRSPVRGGRQFWREFARAAVRAQEIFVHAYPAADPLTATLPSYSACHYDERGCYDAEQMDLVRRRYQPLTIAELAMQAARNAADALGGVGV